MKSGERLSEEIIEQMKDAIADAEGNEVLFVGSFGESGVVEEIKEAARGDDSAAPAIYPFMEQGEVVIHNHPSGLLKPSGADMQVAGRLGNQGVGFYLVDNEVSRVYCVSEPVHTRKEKALEIEELVDYLLPGGRLSKIFPDYESRDVQVEMLEAVTKALNERLYTVIEAGTGVGKSLAYLLPAARWAVQNSERVVVSTATINLQQQLMENDIPLVERILGKSVNPVLVKGRGNYICLRRLQDAADEMSLFGKENSELETIRTWAETTQNGSKSDLSFFPSPEVWSMVCSEADACMGLRCPFREKCFVVKARRAAASSHLLVVNHHLLFSDMSARLEGAGFEATAVLPPTKRIIFDEAHAVERNATSFFSKRYNKLNLFRHLRRLFTRRGEKSYGLAITVQKLSHKPEQFKSVPRHVSALHDAAEKLDQMLLSFLGGEQTRRLQSNTRGKEMVHEPVKELRISLAKLLNELDSGVSAIEEEFEEESEVFELRTIMDRLGNLSAILGNFETTEEEMMVYWIELGRTSKRERFCSLVQTPLEVASLMRKSVFEPNRTVVATSATLTVRKSFSFWLTRVGLAGAGLGGAALAGKETGKGQLSEGDEKLGDSAHEENELAQRVFTQRLESPFAYRERVLLGIPEDAPEPKSGDEYEDFVSKFVGDSLELSEGSGLVLFTSYKMLQHTYDKVAPRLEERGISVLRQGQDDRTRLLSDFHSEISSVLFATNSFWEGVDAPGESLRVVIICRLPFSVPTDPVNKARMEKIEERGGNSFMEYSLPHAAMRLKQGFGRLMRKQTDRGVVCILDSRIITKRYGKVLMDTLPETITKVENSTQLLEDIENFLYSDG